MSEPLQLVDRTRSPCPAFNLTTTFDVLVGDAPGPQQLFPVYHDVLTKRSGFLRAARSAQWLKDPKKPVDLKDEDPETFSLYLNCAYFGAQAIRRKPANCDDSNEGKSDKECTETNHNASSNTVSNNAENININNAANANSANSGNSGNDDSQGNDNIQDNDQTNKKDAFERSEQDCAAAVESGLAQETEYSGSDTEQFDLLIKVYILADKLQDPSTANAVIDEIVDFGEETRQMPSVQAINLTYRSTVHGHSLRRLLRDCYVYDISGSDRYMRVHTDDLPLELYRDIAVRYLRRKHNEHPTRAMRDVYWFNIKTHIYPADPCRYHQHDEKHPRCGPKVYEFDRPFTPSYDGW